MLSNGACEPLRLCLGAGTRPLEGYVNCDLYPHAGIDCAFDLMAPWPFKDHSVSEIYASHVLEHLPKYDAFFREAWRVLEDGGRCRIRVPEGNSRSAWSDPSHLRPWYPESFGFLQPDYVATTHNLQFEDCPTPFEITRCGVVVARWVLDILRWRWLYYLVQPWLHRIPDAFHELIVDIRALKSEKSLRDYHTRRTFNAIYVCYFAWEHDWNHQITGPNTGGYVMLDVGHKGKVVGAA